MDWWREDRSHPLDARLVDLRAPEFGLVGPVEEMAQRPARAAAEVQRPAARQAPTLGQHPEDLVVAAAPDPVVELERVGAVGQRADPVR
jgi:hypothetical protein